jgi:hypothetical protein
MKKMTYGFFVDFGEFEQFHHVDASLAAFALREEGVGSAHQGGDLTLGQICLLTSSSQPF